MQTPIATERQDFVACDHDKENTPKAIKGSKGWKAVDDEVVFKRTPSSSELQIDTVIDRDERSPDLCEKAEGIVPPSPNDRCEVILEQLVAGMVRTGSADIAKVARTASCERAAKPAPHREDAPTAPPSTPVRNVAAHIQEIVGSEDSPVGTGLLVKKLARRVESKRAAMQLNLDKHVPDSVPKLRSPIDDADDASPASAEREAGENDPGLLRRREARKRYNRQAFSPSMGFTAQEVAAFRNGQLRIKRKAYNQHVYSPSMGESYRDVILRRALESAKRRGADRHDISRPRPISEVDEVSAEVLPKDRATYNAYQYSPSMGLEPAEKQKLAMQEMQNRCLLAGRNFAESKSGARHQEKLSSDILEAPEDPDASASAEITGSAKSPVDSEDMTSVIPQNLYAVDEEDGEENILAAPSLFTAPGILGMLLGGSTYCFSSSLR